MAGEEFKTALERQPGCLRIERTPLVTVEPVRGGIYLYLHLRLGSPESLHRFV